MRSIVIGMGEDAMVDYLRFCAEAYGSHGRRAELVYNSPEAFVLAHGVRFEMKPLPFDVEWGEVGYCYSNAFEIASELHYVYCEGFATGVLGLPIHHAWLLDPDDGLAFDVTWRVEHDPRDYMGVAIPFDVVTRANQETGLYAVLGTKLILGRPWPYVSG